MAVGPGRMIVVALGAIVAIGGTLAIIFKMNEGSNSPSDSIQDAGQERTESASAPKTSPTLPRPENTPPPTLHFTED